PNLLDDAGLVTQGGDLDCIVGSRTDDAHVALEDVPQLWKLIETKASKNLPDRGNSRIALEFVVTLIFCSNSRILVEQLLQPGIGVAVHRAELQAGKYPTILADTHRAIQDGTGRFSSYSNGHYGGKGQNRDAEQKNHGDV